MASQRQKTERFIWRLFLDIVFPLLPDRGRRKNHWLTEMSASFKGGPH